MPRIKDYPKYEDHVDKTMTWDKSNKELLPPGRTKLLQDGRFIFDMDDGTYTVSMQYFIENVLGLVNKDKKTIITDVTVDGLDNSEDVNIDKIVLVIHKENIDADGNLTGHKTKVSYKFTDILGPLVNAMNTPSAYNIATELNNDFITIGISYSDPQSHKSEVFNFQLPVHGISNLDVSDGTLTYKVDGKDQTIDLKETINNVVSNSGEFSKKVQDLVDFRMSPMTPLINSAITSIEVSDAGNMHWLSYDGNTTDGSFDFGAFVDKKVASAKPADLPTDLTRNLNITDSGTATWTVNGEQKSVDIANGVTRQVNAKFAMRVDQLSQRVGKAVTNFDINNAGVTTWTSGGDSHTFDIGSMVDQKIHDAPHIYSLNIDQDSGGFVWLDNLKRPKFFELKTFLSQHVPSIVEEKLKDLPKTTIDKYIKEFNASFNNDGTFTWVTSDGETHTFSMHDNLGSYFGPYKSRVETLESSKADQSWVKDQISQAITTYSSGAATGQRLAKFAKELNVDGGGMMTWTSSDGQSHSVNLRRFISSSSVSSIPESDVESVL